jgi:prepilin-type N-terminal cleavage/methylation domain-containing protein
MYFRTQKATRILKDGFTLIELLIVMAVMGVLGTIVVFNFPAGTERARDTHRRADLKQYQTALETFANKEGGIYPVDTADTSSDGPSDLCGTGNDLENYENCPVDPRDGDVGECSGENCGYHYMSNATGTEYSMWAALERPPEFDDIWFVVCSNGLTSEGDTAPVAGALCP